MTEQWDPDIEINTPLAHSCIEAQFPDLTIDTFQFVDEGWDNKVFLLNDTIIFRFPRREIAVSLIETENTVLPSLQSLLPLPIPNPLYRGIPSPQYPYPFQGYKKILGRSGAHAQLTASEREASIEILALFLKTLHKVDAAQARAMGVGAPAFDRTNTNDLVSRLRVRIDQIGKRNICVINKKCFDDEMASALDLVLPTHEYCLIHGDFYSRHILFHEGRLTGVIDWGDLGISHPAVDLGIVWSFYPRQCDKLFFDCYGDVDQSTWQYARFFGIYSAFTVILYAHGTGDPSLLNEGLDSIRRINPALVEAS